MAPRILPLRPSEGSWARGAGRSACALETEARTRGLEATVSEKPLLPQLAHRPQARWQWGVATGNKRRQNAPSPTESRRLQLSIPGHWLAVKGPLCSQLSVPARVPGITPPRGWGMPRCIIKGDVPVVILESILISQRATHPPGVEHTQTLVGRQHGVRGRALKREAERWVLVLLCPWCWAILCRSLALSELFPICTGRDQTAWLSQL